MTFLGRVVWCKVRFLREFFRLLFNFDDAGRGDQGWAKEIQIPEFKMRANTACVFNGAFEGCRINTEPI